MLSALSRQRRAAQSPACVCAVMGVGGAEGWRRVGASCEGRVHLLLHALVQASVHPAACMAGAAVHTAAVA
jgi:hypothetical protein